MTAKRNETRGNEALKEMELDKVTGGSFIGKAVGREQKNEQAGKTNSIFPILLPL